MRHRRIPDYAALFDLDGVIIDTRAATKEALRVLAAATAAPVDPAALEACVMLPPVDALLSLGVPDARQAYRDHFDSALALAVGELRIFDAVVSGMAALAEAGIGLGIVTAQARSRLSYLLPPAVTELIDVLIAHEDAPPKPAPDGVLAACAQLGIPAQRALFVGDTPTDVQAGRAAGALTVGAGWGFGGTTVLSDAGVDVLLNTPDQVGPQMLVHLEGRLSRTAVTP
ncbi:haloacid dehalogenase [Nocardia nova]|uniref:Haloacid dehalogenase n=1 Tax=Nocardia nova TaxID=37330 RepID=A0A2S6APZ3_9NOCA|nr:HAD family hydrolase [Nocardia nova]PPJ19753.1 haloacid dehalogenase [Nocardia nova]PPJ37269.1 haloacid dehalogenase [Nocardia nova]